jgi:hypothetical protein
MRNRCPVSRSIGQVNYFRMAGDPPATREDVQYDLRKCLDEWFVDYALVNAS